MVDIRALDRTLRDLTVPTVLSGVRRIDASDISGLEMREREHVAGAVEKRQREFATGRRLLRELIGVAEPILVLPGGRPALPAGVVGSLAHDRDVAVAVVSRDQGIAALGIDVEPDVPLTPAVARIILRADEHSIDPHLAFTMKEATYKAWSAMGGPMLDHHDVRLELDDRRFRANIVGGDVEFEGTWATEAGRHLAFVAAEHDATRSRMALGRAREPHL